MPKVRPNPQRWKWGLSRGPAQRGTQKARGQTAPPARRGIAPPGLHGTWKRMEAMEQKSCESKSKMDGDAGAVEATDRRPALRERPKAYPP
ncbi:hypothetical protein G7046_g5723 [Stylonectria norvegica]|nr:hypothetical protein G7046_g5723 [Stylonectria norvegica]